MKVRFAVGPPGGAVSGSDLVSFALALEEAGFDGIWLSDLPVAPVLDPLLALALIAGRTRTLRLGANIVPFGRSPYVLAKTLAQLDQVCDGRLLLSFVTGLGQPGERSALGLDDVNRGAALEEVLAHVRSLWGADEGARPVPPEMSRAALAAARPLQDPLEVWLGGRGPWIESAGLPTGGSERSSPRPRHPRRASASRRRPRTPGARSTPSISA
jgi:alkanesulfonate monooxygenase SsuD/methylene tetrahydromethanopterin reductase-like flavin-dependent oxidoreductase (luciferase family)